MEVVFKGFIFAYLARIIARQCIRWSDYLKQNKEVVVLRNSEKKKVKEVIFQLLINGMSQI